MARGHARQYVFISTMTVYAANDTPGAEETAAVSTTDTPDRFSYWPVRGWSDLPVWIASEGACAGFTQRSITPEREKGVLAGWHAKRGGGN